MQPFYRAGRHRSYYFSGRPGDAESGSFWKLGGFAISSNHSSVWRKMLIRLMLMVPVISRDVGMMEDHVADA